MSVILRSNHPQALWPGVQAFFGQVYDRHEEEWKQLFELKTSDKNEEIMVQNTGFGLAPVKQEGSSIAYDTDQQGYTARFTSIVYGLGYIVSEEEMEDNQYESVSMDRAQSLKISMVETKENVCANVYNRAFSSSYVGGDGVSLLNTAHPTLSGNQSNKLATDADFSQASLEDMIVQIMGATNDRGIKIKIMPQTLLVPRQLVFEAERVLNSQLQSDTANHAVNAVRSLNVIPNGVKVNHYFTDPDAWFIRTNVVKGLTHFQRRKMNFTKDGDFGTGNALAKATERYSVGFGDWRSLFGTAGS